MKKGCQLHDFRGCFFQLRGCFAWSPWKQPQTTSKFFKNWTTSLFVLEPQIIIAPLWAESLYEVLPPLDVILATVQGCGVVQLVILYHQKQTFRPLYNGLHQ
jgi:hypothetical protein